MSVTPAPLVSFGLEGGFEGVEFVCQAWRDAYAAEELGP
jgi:hypothetical protein